MPEETENGYCAGYTGNYLRAYVQGELPCRAVSVIVKEKFRGGVLAEIKGE